MRTRYRGVYRGPGYYRIGKFSKPFELLWKHWWRTR